MGATVLASFFAIKAEKRVPYFSLYISCVTLLFGGSTLFFHEPHFVQMRDTFYDIVLGVTILWMYVHGKLVFKSVFSHSIVMSNNAWKNLTHAWIFFFFFLAGANEVARHVLTPGDWVLFKLAMLVVTTCFGLWALFYYFESIPEEER
jgi:intracellular septation protein